jgi:hypothetical protein
MSTLTWDPRIGTHRADIERRMKEHQTAWSYSWLARQRRREFWDQHKRYCDRCGWTPDTWTLRERHLEVHHVNYDHPAGDEPDSALRGLCTRCHDAIHTRHRQRYIWGRSYWRRDHWPYEHLERVTDRAIWFGWWRRLLRTRPA